MKAAPPGQFKMGGTGSKQEDQIITVAIEKSTGTKFTYIPYRGGGEVAVQLVGNHVDSTVNNPIEAVAQWRGGQLRPLCVFDGKQLEYADKVAGDMAWNDIPTCKSQGLDMEYLMLRGIFMTPGATPDQVAFYVDLLKKVRETPEWKDLMKNGAFNQTFMTGAEYAKWVEKEEARHRDLMKEAGFLAQPTELSRRLRPAGADPPDARARASGVLHDRRVRMSHGGAGPSHRGVEIGVAIAMLLFAAIIMYGAWIAGIGWGAEGPRAGFFPFYVGLSILLATLVNLAHALSSGPQEAVRRVGQLAPGARRSSCRRRSMWRWCRGSGSMSRLSCSSPSS